MAKTYGRCEMQVTTENFHNYAKELPEKVIDKDVIEQNVWIIPVPFYAMRCINDPRQFPVDTTMETERWKKPRKKYEQLLQGWSPSSAKDCSTSRVLSV